ncbi:MAG: histidinol dehydrogenase, partial [Anaerolineales bacterium]|nr:histidinol dehydrogenase [Anaerolineales bacterium]
MLNIYDVPTAQNTILKRIPLHTKTYPPRLVKSVEALFGKGVTPAGAVSIILESISQDGDAALRKWSSLIDKTELEDFRIPSADLKAAYKNLDPSLLAALQLAVQRIRQFHEHQPLPNWETDKLGGILGQRVTAVEKAGVYVPGGTAPLPSSLLMSVIPAQVAGVEQIIVCTPPNPHASILACGYLCGIDQVYQLGGAQA